MWLRPGQCANATCPHFSCHHAAGKRTANRRAREGGQLWTLCCMATNMIYFFPVRFPPHSMQVCATFCAGSLYFGTEYSNEVSSSFLEVVHGHKVTQVSPNSQHKKTVFF